MRRAVDTNEAAYQLSLELASQEKKLGRHLPDYVRK